MEREYFLLVDGQAVPGASTFDVINPALGKPFAKCPKADLAILDQAVAAAKRAFPGWAATPIDERARLLASIADALNEKIDDFAAVLTAEQGKPLDQAAGEVKGAVNILRTFATMRLEPKLLRDDGRQRIVEHRVPLGVVGAITPWNFPLVLLVNKVGPALMAGNTMVAKPAPTTPLTTLMFGELCRDVLPAGVFNVVCDENELGAALSSHPGIAKISFTGSTATGKKVLASTAETLKRVTLELGGNDAAIVLDDVDTKKIARKVFDGAMRNAGQVCIATKRAYVPEAIYDEFCEELGRIARETVVDDGTRQGAQIGPVQNRQQYEKLTALIEDAASSGTIVAGGEPMDGPGYFIRPTIVRDIADDAPLVREEQFGPVLPVLKYSDIDELLERVNDTEYGLGGTIWATDIDRASTLALRVRSGTVWVNRPQGVDPRVPFRGAKQSGIGTEMGEAGFEEYTQGQIVSVSLGELV
ncbi:MULTISPECIES: aldehyde dehydrogenase family protein [unclassified Sphingomonas]|uniref:aldehyde dehydrogenase family protein n=1 Tax=unclassified Sphingomonas TaxID=196159 RepID=UPI0006F6A74A|nr:MULTISPECIES: aldehyde dehydrogenase family protein [unclassified Sphingomonas]KQX17475.1 aldehyde dehydrogenase [Sphingomonas sp. Root1294]KQY70401.1 aldehyde dehydrogenase [Sphingomonas sp. Root50]KRB92113.1 aldehyde dehydrogenase [Sphingomonas sp. Root720]